MVGTAPPSYRVGVVAVVVDVVVRRRVVVVVVVAVIGRLRAVVVVVAAVVPLRIHCRYHAVLQYPWVLALIFPVVCESAPVHMLTPHRNPGTSFCCLRACLLIILEPCVFSKRVFALTTKDFHIFRFWRMQGATYLACC